MKSADELAEKALMSFAFLPDDHDFEDEKKLLAGTIREARNEALDAAIRTVEPGQSAVLLRVVADIERLKETT